MKKILIFIILTFILTSCEVLGKSDLSDSQNQQNMLYPPAVEYSDSDGYPVMTPIGNDIIDIKNPDKGLSAITGKLLLLDNRPMNNATIYLTLGKGDTNEDPPAILVGPELSKGDFASHTDQFANFFLNNIQPGTYYLIASSTNNYSIIIGQDNKPLKITLNPDEMLNLGEVKVDLP